MPHITLFRAPMVRHGCSHGCQDHIEALQRERDEALRKSAEQEAEAGISIDEFFAVDPFLSWGM